MIETVQKYLEWTDWYLNLEHKCQNQLFYQLPQQQFDHKKSPNV